MATWVKCTHKKDGGTVLVNLDAAVAITETKSGTIIAFPGDDDSFVHVKETVADIVKRGGIKHA